MGALSFSRIWVTNMKLIDEKNPLNITVWMSMNPYKLMLFLRFLRTTLIKFQKGLTIELVTRSVTFYFSASS